MKGDLCGLMEEFHSNAKLFPQCFSSYFLALVPKFDCPQRVSDFRSISLLGCLYKIVAKTLALPPSEVMDSLIASDQSAFVFFF